MWKHGTVGGYSRHKCRCPECSKAQAVYIKKYKQDRKNGISRKKEPWKHGTSYGRYDMGCECDLCKNHWKIKNEPKLASGDFKHGTSTGYGIGCRCDECREGCRQRALEYRRFVGIGERKRADHGSATMYIKGCRCDLCLIAYRNKYPLKRKKPEDPIQKKLKHTLRSRIRMVIKTNAKSGSDVRDLGCSVEYFREYLESQFVDGMSWDNYGKKIGDWSIDHIMPLNLFDLTGREQFLRACHYTNMRPLWHVDNMKRPDDGSDIKYILAIDNAMERVYNNV